MSTLEGIQVELVEKMGTDLMVSNVARVSFDKWKEEFDRDDERLIKYLANHEHSSPFRHPQLQLRCKAPVFLARQLQKHTVGLTWNEVSRRYVDVNIEFYVPDTWRGRPENGIKQGSGEKEVIWLDGGHAEEGLHSVKEEYADFLSYAEGLYNTMLDNGIAPEMARMVLPQSMMCTWIWTGSLQAFYHVWRLRSGEGAQVEAKEFASLLDNVIEPLFPACWQALKAAA